MWKVIVVIFLCVSFYKCTGGQLGTDKIFGPPDELPISRYEDLYVHVWFWFPDDEKSYYLGRTKGASSCGAIAHDYAASKNMNLQSNWSYVCCTEEDGSQCYRKIR